MKIISNFKDYYDWCVSIYGIDGLYVYERKSQSEARHSNYWTHAPGGTKLETHVKKYRDSDIIFTPLPKEEQFEYNRVHQFLICDKLYTVYYFDGNVVYHDVKDLPHKPNAEENCPVILWGMHTDTFYRSYSRRSLKEYVYSNSINAIKNPKLSDHGFGSVVPAEEMFIMIYNWLSRNKDIPNKQSNKEKIESHGFDVKRSFRPKMK